ncbi:hypothetical protein SAMN05421594_0401 [Chryseobacterium oleae]|uniref:Uncharacterized protein n=1 Tax=Chryseobacterium oleae TaxID=491207 RepID=A0A1I4VKV7_CHROL|nr:hypothetical protein [Chryseobacterium oleae]SFN01868.1 hypothetical protein SAMN05421594_0401 [Chryseobacterium oleae]
MILKNEKLHKEIYEKISSMYGIKFKAQLKDSPIEFYKFSTLNDIISDKESYLIIFANKESIKFRNKSEFLKEFMNYIYCKILELENQFNELNNREYNGMKYDKNNIFMQHEEIGNGQYKLNQILKKFETFKNKKQD